MKNFLVIVLIFFCALFIYGEDIITLPEVNKPRTIQIDGDQIFITENVRINIYSITTQKFIKFFGKRGEGPGEFKIMDNAEAGVGVQISIRPGYILVNSIGKLTWFDRIGKYIKEVNTHKSRGPYGRNFIPIGNNFVAYDFVREEKTGYITISLFNMKLKKLKDLYRHPFFVQHGKKTNPEIWRPSVFFVLGDSIFLDTQEGAIEVYDPTGKRKLSIAPDYPLAKETTGRIEAYWDFLKADPRFRDHIHIFKDTLEFPKHLPLIRYYTIDQKYIYVLTNRQKEGQGWFFIIDHEGNIVRKLWAPLLDKTPIEPYPYTVHNGSLYQIVENPDTDEWELRIRKL